MVKMGIIAAVAAFVVFYIIKSPDQATTIAKGIGHLVDKVAHGIGHFIDNLTN